MSLFDHKLCEMHAIEERYYKIIRFFLKLLGLWPYQQSYFARVHKILFAGILLVFAIAQLLAFFTMQFNINLFLKILSFVCPTFFAIVKYCSFVIQTDDVKQLFERTRADWTLLNGKLEVDIIKRYADNMRLITMITIIFCHIGVFYYILLQFLPIILDVMLSLNESRSCELLVITEYFINREKYICVMLLYEIIFAYIGIITICTTVVTIVIHVLHTCALFRVASYRMENAIRKDILAIPDPIRNSLLYQRIVHAVFMHRRAIRYIQLWMSSFTEFFAILIVIGVISLSLNLFQLFHLIKVRDDLNEICIIFILVAFHVCYMFIINYSGEEIQNHGMQVFDATYNGLWYAAPPRIQKLVLFVMQRAAVKVNVICGNIFIASMEGFVTLVSTAVSYFTVIYSTRL